jgi:cell wall-associated NlpC family hydrolase
VPGLLKRPPAGDDVMLVATVLPEAPARPRRVMRRRALSAATGLLAATAIAAAVALASSGDGTPRAATGAAAPAAAPAPRPAVPEAVATPQKGDQQQAPIKSHPRVVQALAPGTAPPDGVTAGSGSGAGSAPASDAQVRAELAQFRQHLQGVGAQRGEVPSVSSDGTAVAPLGAPAVVAAVIAAGNEIATKPYKWGGGHGAWRDSGYDCSGSISFALAGAGLLNSPLDSTRFMKWGAPGQGRWITIYANGGHAFMVVAGLRFDTSGAQGGTRWQAVDGRSYAGFAVRHPPGL